MASPPSTPNLLSHPEPLPFCLPLENKQASKGPIVK